MTSEPLKILADTHALVWYFAESSRLSRRADDLLQSVELGDTELIVPTIVLAEAISLAERKEPGITVEQLFEKVAALERAMVSLDLPVLREVTRLSPDLEMHDRIIAATARVYGAALISRDRQLGSLVETVW